MEIRIKTATEFHDSHVTISIVTEGQGEAGEFLELANRAGKVPALERRVAELEVDRDKETAARRAAEAAREELAQIKVRMDRELSDARQIIAARGHLDLAHRQERECFRVGMESVQAEASEARRHVIQLTQALEEQRQRADENLAWAERAEAGDRHRDGAG